MALTRNESAVHEKIGVYDKVITGDHNAMVLGENIDLRIFPKVWAHGFAVEKRDGEEIRRSLQFFDEAGRCRAQGASAPGVQSLRLPEAGRGPLPSADQSPAVALKGVAEERAGHSSEAAMCRRSARPLEPHDRRASVLRHAEDAEAVAPPGRAHDRRATMPGSSTDESARRDVQSRGRRRACRSCASSAIAAASRSIPARSSNIKPMGPWINVLDETFHLHLRLDHVRELWAVRKPTKDGHVTSLEAYGADNQMIIQFFGKRHEGEGERDDWRVPGRKPAARIPERARPEEQFHEFVSRTFARILRAGSLLVVAGAGPGCLCRGGQHGLQGHVAHRLGRRLDHRDRLCARRRRTSSSPAIRPASIPKRH